MNDGRDNIDAPDQEPYEDPDQRLGGHDHVGDMLDADNPKGVAEIMDMIDTLVQERDDYRATLGRIALGTHAYPKLAARDAVNRWTPKPKE